MFLDVVDDFLGDDVVPRQCVCSECGKNGVGQLLVLSHGKWDLGSV